MATFDLPEPHVSPNLFVGAASPLWGYFGAAAASGLAYWWMTRWTRPQNLEALFGVAAASLAPLAEAAETRLQAAEMAIDDLPAPVGGESAPISPLVEAATAVEPTLEAEEAPVEAALDQPKPRLRKGQPLSGLEDEA